MLKRSVRRPLRKRVAGVLVSMLILMIFTAILILKLLIPETHEVAHTPPAHADTEWKRLPSGVWEKVGMGTSGIPVTAHVSQESDSIVIHVFQECKDTSRKSSMLWIFGATTSIFIDCNGKDHSGVRPQAVEKTLLPFPEEINTFIQSRQKLKRKSIEI